MTHEELTALRDKIDQSPGLKNFEKKLSDELFLRAEQGSYGIDPLTILFIISIILQVISICRRERTDADIELDMVNANMLPPRKLMRLKRRLNVVWKEHCEKNATDPGTKNPFFDAAITAVRGVSRSDVTELVSAAN